MKQAFVNSWIKSKQPRKQRKYRHNAPQNIKKKYLAAHLSTDLREKHKVRSMVIRKGDTVKIVRGDHKGKVGKVERVSLKYSKVYIENIMINKKDGSKKSKAIEPSNVMITILNLEDKKRAKRFERAQKVLAK